MDVFTTLVVPAVVGVVVGILSGMLGIGGGTILVPTFRLLFGMSPIMCTATSLFTIIPTSISGSISHIRHKTCIPSLGIAAGVGGALTSPLGVWLAHLSPAWAVMLAAALVIGWSAINMLMKAFKMKKVAPASLGEPDSSDKDAVLDSEQKKFPQVPRKQLFIGFAIGLVAGVASGYVGLGGGFLMVPLMVSILGISMKQTSGTSLIAVILLAIPAAIEQGILGNIDYVLGSIVAAGSIPGALLGARFVRKVPERTLRFIFGGFLIVAAAVMMLSELKIFG